MSRKFKFHDNNQIYFISFAVINWIDAFIRNKYKEVLPDGLRFCELKKDFDVCVVYNDQSRSSNYG